MLHQDARPDAVALQRRGRWAEAEAIYDRLLRRAPNNVLALHDLGMVRYQLGRHDEAEALLRRALALDPGYARAHNNLGVMLQAAGRLDEACACFTLASRHARSLAAPWLHLGIALAGLERLEESRAALRHCVERAGDDATAWANLGAVLVRLNDIEAEPALQRALALDPGQVVALKALGDLRLPQGRTAEAEGLYRRAAVTGETEALCKLGTALRLLGRLGEAETVLRQALAHRPGHAAGRFNLALTLLAGGRDAEAWPDFEARRQLPGAAPPLPGLPLWQGEPLAGRTLLLTDEQGLGDTLQFVRFAPLVRDAGRVVLVCRPELVELLHGAAGLDAVVGRDRPLPAADLQAPLLSLPALCGGAEVRGEAYLAHCQNAPSVVIPAKAGIQAMVEPSGRRRSLDSRFRGNDEKGWCHATRDPRPLVGLSVGLVTAGNPAHPLDRLRSLPEDALALLPRLDGVTYVDLRPDSPTPLAVTAALMAGLDLVVSVDTAAAHLAGALGKPLWLLLPHAADWRWGPEGEHSRWYASARLFRQPAPGDWEAALLRLGAELARRAGVPEQSLRAVEAAFAAGRLDDAEAALWGALAGGADPADGLRMLGAIRLSQGDAAGAARLSRAALALRPDADAANNLGVALRRLGRTEEARTAFEQACRLDPRHAGARYNLANLLGDGGRLEEALDLYREAIRLSPGHGGAHYNLANALRDLGRLDEAAEAYRRALVVDPGNAAEIRNSLGMCLLLAGRYAEGWRDYEARRQTGRLPDRALPLPDWDGRPGVTVLLHAEQGFGDTLQFVRYVPLAARRGARIVLEVPPGLAELCRSLAGAVPIIAQGDPVPPADAQLPLLSLPRLLGTARPEDVPQHIPYLAADPARAAEWARRLAPLDGVRIGLVWAGNPRHRNDARRSLPLSAFAGLPAGVGFSYVSLQLGPAAADLAPSLMRNAIHDLGPHIRDFSDTAAIVDQIDLVVCCDTAVAHLAGALGKPVWLLLPHAPDWRWGLAAEATPWYPEMRLFRQPAPGDWATPLRSLAAELRRFVPARDFQAALAHHQAGRADQAAAGYRRLLARRPDHAEALHHLGLLALAGDRLDEAERWLRRALAAGPDLAAAWSNLGIVLRRAGRLDQAVAAYRAALDRNPHYLQARYNLGNALRDAGRAEQAEAAFRAVLAARPDHRDAWNNLALTLQGAERFAEAEIAFRRARALDPGFPDAAANLALLHHAAKRFDAALAEIAPAAARWPSHSLVRRTEALILKANGRIAEAEAVCRAALELEPGNAEGFNLLGSILSAQNRLDEAAAALRQALERTPDYAEALWMLGFVELLRGELRSGWRHFEARWRLGILAPLRRRMTRPEWDGRRLAGETLLVFAEQGLGDTFHFARYLPLAAERGARVIVEAQPAALPLLARLPGVAGTVALGQPLPAHELHIPLLSLPRLFDTTLETVPAAPYLSAEPARRDTWRDRLAALPCRRVGLVWAGNPDHGNDRNRSLRFDQLAPLLALPGLSLVSLQLGAAAAQRSGAVVDLGPEIADYEDTAAILEQLDLLISVDTSVAHCAGALGRPVWTLLPFAPDWRWLLERSDTPWYPSMRLFRQPAPGAWEPVVAAVAVALDNEQIV